eukprot:scaffold25308_cov124-Isochrysis_galbana.AAC.6
MVAGRPCPWRSSVATPSRPHPSDAVRGKSTPPPASTCVPKRGAQGSLRAACGAPVAHSPASACSSASDCVRRKSPGSECVVVAAVTQQLAAVSTRTGVCGGGWAPSGSSKGLWRSLMLPWLS